MEEDGFNGDNDPAALLEVVVLLDETNRTVALYHHKHFRGFNLELHLSAVTASIVQHLSNTC